MRLRKRSIRPMSACVNRPHMAESIGAFKHDGKERNSTPSRPGAGAVAFIEPNADLAA